MGTGWAPLELKLQLLKSRSCRAPPALPLSTAAWQSKESMEDDGTQHETLKSFAEHYGQRIK